MIGESAKTLAQEFRQELFLPTHQDHRRTGDFPVKPRLDYAHAGNLVADDSHRMTFDEAATAHLMSVLTDLYSDPALAVIREYSTNAWDAHVAAGIDRPIEVDMPTTLNPMLTIRDFGVGMSHDTIVNQFSKYGWSSKRDSDSQVGMLGLGCKSALSYTGQFTLTSTHNGETTSVLITREADGCGAVNVMFRAHTGRPNGTEVVIPVSVIRDIERAAAKFYPFWDASQVLVDGKPYPGNMWEQQTISTKWEGINIDPDIMLLPAGNPSFVVMGNVPYEVPNPRELALPLPFIARVPIGTVDFTPSREKLHLTKRTKETLDAIVDYIGNSLAHQCEKQFKNAKSWEEAIILGDKWWEITRHMRFSQSSVIRSKMQYKFEPVPINPRYYDCGWLTVYESSTDDFLLDGSARSSADYKDMRNCILFITGWSGQRGVVTLDLKHRLTAWIRENYPDPKEVLGKTIILHADKKLPDWVDGMVKRKMTAEEFLAVTPARKRVATKTKPKYTLFGYGWDKQVIDPTDPTTTTVAWMTRADGDDRTRLEIARMLGAYSEVMTLELFGARHQTQPLGRAVEVFESVAPKMKEPGTWLANSSAYGVVMVPAASLGKFLRENPDVPHITEWVDTVGRAFIMNQSEMRLGLTFLSGQNAYDWSAFRVIPEAPGEKSTIVARAVPSAYDSTQDLRFVNINMDFTKVMDPDLRRFRDAYRLVNDNHAAGVFLALNAKAIKRMLEISELLGINGFGVPERALTMLRDFRAVLKKYPLLKADFRYNPKSDAIIQYLNAVYLMGEQLNLNPFTY